MKLGWRGVLLNNSFIKIKIIPCTYTMHIWETVLHESLASACLARGQLSAFSFVQEVTLDNRGSVCLWSKGQVCLLPQKSEILSPFEQMAIFLTAHYQRFEFPKLHFLCCNTCDVTWPSVGIGAQGRVAKMLILAISAISNK